jgi:cell division protein FtsB
MDLRIKDLHRIRVLPRPADSLRALVNRAPQAEAWAERATEKLRPAWTRLYSARRRMATAAVGVLTVWLFVHVMFGANGMVVYRQKRTEYQDLQLEVDRLQKENGAYNQRIKALETDSRTIEKEAREQLHYGKPGEVIYVAPPPLPPPQPPTNAARK